MQQKARDIKLTYEDYLLFPDDGKRHELIDGEHYMTPSPSTRHQKISRNLFYFLEDHLRKCGGGELFDAPMDVVLSDQDVVQPDLLFVSVARKSIITERNIQGPPDLVIEITSEGTRKIDERTKRKLYEGYGVIEYWIVDSELESVKVYQMTEKGYVRNAELSREKDDMLTTHLLPGLKISLNEVFG